MCNTITPSSPSGCLAHAWFTSPFTVGYVTIAPMSNSMAYRFPNDPTLYGYIHVYILMSLFDFHEEKAMYAFKQFYEGSVVKYEETNKHTETHVL